MTECKYQHKGNMCTSVEYCKDKHEFDKPVLSGDVEVYGVCKTASCF